MDPTFPTVTQVITTQTRILKLDPNRKIENQKKEKTSLVLYLRGIENKINSAIQTRNHERRDPCLEIDGMFQNLQNISQQSIQQLKSLLKSKIPNEPDRSKFNSTEEFNYAYDMYEMQMQNLKLILNAVKIVIAKLTEAFNRNLHEIKDFYTKMWDKIKKGEINEAEREMQNFNRNLSWKFKEAIDEIEDYVKKSSIEYI